VSYNHLKISALCAAVLWTAPVPAFAASSKSKPTKAAPSKAAPSKSAPAPAASSPAAAAAAPAQASSPSKAMPSFLSVESFTSASYGGVSSAEFSEAASVLNYSEDLTVLYNLDFIKVGLGGSFRLMNHMSDNTAKIGNFRGTRWEAYLAVGTKLPFEDIGVMVAPIVILGSYSLTNKTTGGETLSYENPLGGRVFITKDLGSFGPIPGWGFGLFGDYTIYQTRHVGAKAPTDLANSPLSLWNAGLLLHLDVL
jgi:hypothetical protein